MYNERFKKFKFNKNNNFTFFHVNDVFLKIYKKVFNVDDIIFNKHIDFQIIDDVNFSTKTYSNVFVDVNFVVYINKQNDIFNILIFVDI